MSRAAWKVAVGPRIAGHSQVVSLVRDHLILDVEDSVWQRNLYKLNGFILHNLRDALGSDMVKSLEFRVAIPRRQPGRADALRQRVDTVEQPADEADRIGDPYMKRMYKTSRRRASA